MLNCWDSNITPAIAEIFFKCNIYGNKTRTSKVGAIPKAQKAQNIFFGKTKFWIFPFEKGRIVPKNVKGGFFDLQTYILLQNNKKLKRGTL